MKKLIKNTIVLLVLILSQNIFGNVSFPFSDVLLKLDFDNNWKWENVCKTGKFSCVQGSSSKYLVSIVSLPGSKEAFLSTCSKDKRVIQKNNRGLSFCKWTQDGNWVVLMNGQKNVISISMGTVEKNKKLSEKEAIELLNHFEFTKG